MEHEGRKINRLDRRHLRELEDWLEELWPSLEKRPATCREVAAMADVALAFQVTPANIKGAVTAIGKESLPGRRKNKPSDHEMDQIRMDILVLASVVADVHMRCAGMKHEDVTEIVERLRGDELFPEVKS